MAKDVERCEARLPDVDELAEKDDLERLEFRVDKLEGDVFVDPDDFDDLECRVRMLEEANRRVQFEARRFETSGLGDSKVGDPETTVLRDPDDFVELAEFDDLKRRVEELEGVLRACVKTLVLETQRARNLLVRPEGEPK